MTLSLGSVQKYRDSAVEPGTGNRPPNQGAESIISRNEVRAGCGSCGVSF